MPTAHYRLSTAIVASLSLMISACASSPPAQQATTAPPGAGGSPHDPANIKTASADPPGEMDTEATIWTVLGLAKKPSVHQPGPRTGSTVSPILWQAALDTLGFAKFSTQDPLTGELVTEWYSPKDKPDERYKIDVFILAREVRSDAVAVTINRQQRAATGEWTETTVARKVQDDLETAILRRAGQLKREWMKAYASK